MTFATVAMASLLVACQDRSQQPNSADNSEGLTTYLGVVLNAIASLAADEGFMMRWATVKRFLRRTRCGPISQSVSAANAALVGDQGIAERVDQAT